MEELEVISAFATFLKRVRASSTGMERRFVAIKVSTMIRPGRTA